MIPACKKIRKDILKIAKTSGHGHIPTCFSVVEIIFAIYNLMNRDPQNPSWDGRDIFILSKGHASLAHYCILAKFGYIDKKDLHSFGAFMSDYGGHADRKKINGVEVSCGSLGHGIGVGVGIALAFKIKKKHNKVFVLIGDGESNEGSVWESIMVSTNLKLDNLTVIYDNNMSHMRGLQIHNPVEKFKSFDCDVTEVNGHNVESLNKALKKQNENVKVIVANTKKGFGCKTLVENHYEWHRRSPNEEELQKLTRELDEATI